MAVDKASYVDVDCVMSRTCFFFFIFFPTPSWSHTSIHLQCITDLGYPKEISWWVCRGTAQTWHGCRTLQITSQSWIVKVFNRSYQSLKIKLKKIDGERRRVVVLVLVVCVFMNIWLTSRYMLLRELLVHEFNEESGFAATIIAASADISCM